MRNVFAALVVAAAWLLGAQVAVAAQLTFFPLAGSPYATGASPQSIASGADVLATADAGANDVAVFSVASEEHVGPTGLAPGPRVGTGLAPASVAVGGPRPFVAVANRGDNTVSMFAVSGSQLTPVSGSPFATGVGPQSVAFSPDGRLLAVANRGDNTVSMFSVSLSDGSLAPVPGSPFATGSSPQSVAFSNGTGGAGEFLAVANSASNDMSVFSVSSDGSLAPVPGSPFATGSSPRSVAFAPFGVPSPAVGFLAVANSASNNVSMFSLSSDGSLAPVPGSPFATGSRPLDAQFGREYTTGVTLLATANFTDNTVSVFSVSSSGALAPVAGSPLSPGAGSGPSSLEFTGLLVVANGTSSNVSAFVVGANCDTEYNQGYNAGFNSGYNAGFVSEFSTAYRRHGSWQLGWKRGWQAARRSRHAAREPAQVARPAASTSSRPGAVPADSSCPPDFAFNFGFNGQPVGGFNIGYNQGFNAAFNTAFRNGYKAGFAKGRRRK